MLMLSELSLFVFEMVVVSVGVLMLVIGVCMIGVWMLSVCNRVVWWLVG